MTRTVDARGWRLVAIALWLACVLFHAACDRAEPARAGRKIVTVGGPVTEAVFALGAGNEVVAVDTSSVYPEAVATLPKVGYQRLLSAEGVLALAPDLVVASDEAGPPAALEQLRAAGVRVEIVGGAAAPDEAIARVERVAKVIGMPAAPVVDRMRAEIETARKAVPASGPRFVLVYARGAGTLMVSGTDTGGAAMVELAGGRNAVSGFTGFKPLSAEILIDAAPDVIVVPSRGLASLGGEAALLAAPGVADTPAGRTRRIIGFDDALLLGFGPRLGEAIAQLARALVTLPG